MGLFIWYFAISGCKINFNLPESLIYRNLGLISAEITEKGKFKALK